MDHAPGEGRAAQGCGKDIHLNDTQLNDIRLVASDLDGTFLDANHGLHPRCVAAVREASRHGVHIVFATGRPSRWTGLLQPLLDIGYTLIASNGALVLDPGRGRVLTYRAIEPQDAFGFGTDLVPLVPDACFAVEFAHGGWGADELFLNVQRGQSQDQERPGILAPFGQLVTHDAVVKVIAVSASTPTEPLAALCERASAGRVHPTFSFSRAAGFVECSAPGVSKASALRAVLAQQGLRPDQAMAFGDMPNDLEMLRLVGHPYVMAGAHPVVLRAGYPIAGANCDGAVGAIIERELGLGPLTPISPPCQHASRNRGQTSED